MKVQQPPRVTLETHFTWSFWQSYFPFAEIHFPGFLLPSLFFKRPHIRPKTPRKQAKTHPNKQNGETSAILSRLLRYRCFSQLGAFRHCLQWPDLTCNRHGHVSYPIAFRILVDTSVAYHWVSLIAPAHPPIGRTVVGSTDEPMAFEVAIVPFGQVGSAY